jgi:hypothetical protein
VRRLTGLQTIAGTGPSPVVLVGGAVVVLLLLGLNALVLLGDRGEVAPAASVMEDAETPAPAPPATDATRPDPAASIASSATEQPAAAPPSTEPAAGPTSSPAAGSADAAAPGTAPPTSDVQAALPVGTCLIVPSRPLDVASVTPIDCAAEHTGEVFISVVLTQAAGAPFPGRDALEQDGRLLCQGEAFEAYVGVPYTESNLFAFVLAPTEESWAAGDRDVSCFLSDITGPMVGSQRGTG